MPQRQPKALLLLLLCYCCFIGLVSAEPMSGFTMDHVEIEVDQNPLPEQIVLNRHYFPEHFDLCGEAMPLQDQRVWEMMDREFTIAVWNRAQVYLWLKRAARYFPYVEAQLAERELPQDLKYVAVAESDLLMHARSHAGAQGPWQFMAPTARKHGLSRDRHLDERRNFERATTAALDYLTALKEEFDSWTLAMAAYNCGEARMRKEIKEQQVRDYFRLNLPMETERYIFRIAAIKAIMENPEHYGYHLPPDRIYPPLQYERQAVRVRRPVHITKVAQSIGTDFKVLKELNPHIKGYHFPAGKYEIMVPAGCGSQAAALIEGRRALPRATSSGANRHHIVRNGDTLSKIAQQTGVPVDTIKQLNGIEGSIIVAGQKLLIAP